MLGGSRAQHTIAHSSSSSRVGRVRVQVQVLGRSRTQRAAASSSSHSRVGKVGEQEVGQARAQASAPVSSLERSVGMQVLGWPSDQSTF